MGYISYGYDKNICSQIEIAWQRRITETAWEIKAPPTDVA